MKDLYGHRRYIAAQGPIDESLVDFFHMIWQLRIISIICTANDVEAGRVRAFLFFFI
jgi:protein tyrosine phosphatase